MRYVLSILVLFFSISLMTASCGGDDTSSETNACSPTNVNGDCEDGKVCENGTCVVKGTDTECSATNPTGTCPTGQTCNNGVCETGTCTPECSGKVCGNDGCGGSCGTCNGSETCNDAGQCDAGTCTPDCAGKVCGNDGCGGSCGTCATGTCNAGGTCDAPAGDGEIGGTCSESIACVDAGAQCLSADGGVTNTCYQSCNGANDTSCTQAGATCTEINAEIGWICIPPAPAGTTPIGGDCAAENCVAGATCGKTSAGSTCYEDCTGTTDSCSTSDYSCQDTAIGWLCLPGSAGPGTTPIGGDCSSEGCVAGAQCLNTGDGTPQICYENCAAATDTCATSGYTCQDTGVAGIDWICMVNPVGNTPIGGDCANEACVAEATCGSTSAGSTCYEKCAAATDTCSTTDYGCQETAIGWLCVEVAQPGTTPIGGDCATENCVAGATCLGDGTTSTCYEDCDNNNGGNCSTATYTCQAIDGGAEFCFPPATK